MMDQRLNIESASMFEAPLSATIGGVDVRITTSDSGQQNSAAGTAPSNPPARGINIFGIVIIGLLIWFATR